MTDLATSSVEALMNELLFRVLAVRDEALSDLAAEILSRLGPPPVRQLVLVAAGRKKPKRYRLRALKVLQRIGTLADDEASLMEIQDLCGDRDPEICEAAEELLWTISSMDCAK